MLYLPLNCMNDWGYAYMKWHKNNLWPLDLHFVITLVILLACCFYYFLMGCLILLLPCIWVKILTVFCGLKARKSAVLLETSWVAQQKNFKSFKINFWFVLLRGLLLSGAHVSRASSLISTCSWGYLFVYL